MTPRILELRNAFVFLQNDFCNIHALTPPPQSFVFLCAVQFILEVIQLFYTVIEGGGEGHRNTVFWRRSYILNIQFVFFILQLRYTMY